MTDTIFLKHLHALANNYRGDFNFGWVDVVQDEYNIAFSLGIDTLDASFLPCLVLVNGESVYIAPRTATFSYHNIAEYIEEEYAENSLSVWPL